MKRKAHSIKPQSDQSNVEYSSKSINHRVLFLLIRIYGDYNFPQRLYTVNRLPLAAWVLYHSPVPDLAVT